MDIVFATRRIGADAVFALHRYVDGSVDATASGAFAAISLSAPTATATGTTAGNAIATGAPAQITISPAISTAIGSAVASGSFAALGIAPPTATATSAAYGSAIATGSLPVISLTPATGTASTGTFTGSISDEDIARIVTAVLAALQATTTPVNVVAVNGDPVTVWPTANDNADALLSRAWP